MFTAENPRILICRSSAVGDCLITLPILCALRERFPQAWLSWLAEPGPAQLLRGHSSLNELIVTPKGWLKSPRAIFEMRRQLRSKKFDVVIDPQGLTKSSLAGWLSGAGYRIGFAKPRGREISTWLNNILIESSRSHLVDAQMELLRPLGIDRAAVKFDIPRDEAADQSMGQLLSHLHLSCPFAVINVGAGWASRLWPTLRYGRVANHLGRSHGVPSLVVWAGPQERILAEEVVAASGGHAILAPATSLVELCAIFRRATMYLGSDTGPMHLAACVGVPCVALFGTTRPNYSGPYGDQHVCVQQRYHAGSSRHRRRASNSAMCEISIQLVTDACDAILERQQRDVSNRAA